MACLDYLEKGPTFPLYFVHPSFTSLLIESIHKRSSFSLLSSKPLHRLGEITDQIFGSWLLFK